MERVLITGGAGFIGSNLADRLAGNGIDVVVFDNLATGQRQFLSDAEQRAGFSFVEGDVLDRDLLVTAMEGCDTVFHLAANADVRFGLNDPTRDLHQNAVATSTVLEAMRQCDVKNIVFSSTGSVYGEPEVFPTPEGCPFPIQTSLYGASKVAAEGLISAYCLGYGFNAAIFRFVSILGERYSHGHVWDFYRNLKANPSRLKVLGDGNQEKSYLYVQDCIDGILLAAQQVMGSGRVEIFNIGADETLVVNRSVEIICSELGVNPEIEYSGGKRGWIGDSPLIKLDCSKLRRLGWMPKSTIEQSVQTTLRWFDSNPWVFDGSLKTGMAEQS